jgi:hypothetical protein
MKRHHAERGERTVDLGISIQRTNLKEISGAFLQSYKRPKASKLGTKMEITSWASSTRLDQSIPSLGSFSSKGSSSSGSEDSSLMEIQTMKSALCFLCSINADSKEVERFLRRNPEALLFEGTDRYTSVEQVVLEQMKRCTCFVSACNENRKKILKLLKLGFEHYKSMVLMTTAGNDLVFRRITSESNFRITSESNLDVYAGQLQSLECDLREVKTKSESVRSRISETQVQLKTFRFELEGISKQGISNRSSITLLACQRKRTIERRLLLENSLGVATLSVTSLEQEREILLRESRTANRLKEALLKSAFVGCRRHMCEASKVNYA